jgi:uncharacterized membrane protein (UPF0127 family)
MEMMPQSVFKLNRILSFFLLTLLAACQNQVDKDPSKWAWLIAPEDKMLVRLAIEEVDQRRGFSGTRNEDWPDDHGMLFIFEEDGMRGFWMPDTHFDLDLFYLDSSFKIIDIERKVPHFVGRYPESRVPRARVVWARHVLEMKAISKVGAKLKVGDQLRLESPKIPPQIK